MDVNKQKGSKDIRRESSAQSKDYELFQEVWIIFQKAFEIKSCRSLSKGIHMFVGRFLVKEA